MIIHLGPIYGVDPTHERPDTTLQEIKDSEDFHTWQGNACTLPLPGGGNDPTGPGGQGEGKKR